MRRVFKALFLAVVLSAQDSVGYIDLPGRPTLMRPLVSELEGADAYFQIGDKRIWLDKLSLKKPWFGNWKITFTVRNMTDHHLEHVALQFLFFDKDGRVLSDPRTVPAYKIPELGEGPTNSLPTTIAIPSSLRPERSGKAEVVRAYLVSFKARMNASDVAQAARERKQREMKEQEERQLALREAQEKADAEAKAQRDKEELERVEAATIKASKLGAQKAADAARKKQQDAEAQKLATSQVTVPNGTVAAPVAEVADAGAAAMVLITFLLAGAAGVGCAFGYSRSQASAARKIAKHAVSALVRLGQGIRAFQKSTGEAEQLAARNYVLGVQTLRLQRIPIDDLKRLAPGARLQALRDRGFSTVADMQGRSANSLMQIKGIGPDSATRIVRAVAALTELSNRQPIPIPWPGSERGAERHLLEAICHFERSQSWFSDPQGRLASLTKEFRDQADNIRQNTTFWRWLTSQGKHPDIAFAITAAKTLENRLNGNDEAAHLFKEFSRCLAEATSASRAGLPWATLKQEMVLREALYRFRLASLLGTGVAPGRPQTLPPPLPVPSAPVAWASTEPSPLSVTISMGNPASFPAQVMPFFQWVPSGQNLTLGGFKVPGGMVYTGQTAAPLSGGGREASLLDPRLPVQASAADYRVRRMSYWPSYEAISPEARASYLQWLATGKAAPDADIGYVFLYFYGLERRVLIDAPRDPNVQAELPALEQEIVRLLSIYKGNGSFNNYAGSLLGFMRAKHFQESQAAIPRVRGDGLSLDLRRGLGLFAKNGEPLPAEWAYAWYLADPSTKSRTALDRCPDLFKQSFLSVYAQHYAEGLKLPQNKTQLKVSHRPASGSLAGGVYTLELDLPDVSVLRSPVQKLQEIGESVASLLDPYSRFLGRNPGQEHSLDALILLPINFWPAAIRDPIASLRNEVEAGKCAKVMRFVDLQLLLPEGQEFTKGRYGGLCRALEAAEIGIEPDVQYGGGLPEMKDPIALFQLSGPGQPRKPSPVFEGASILLHLASAVASADGEFGEQEARLLLEHIQHGLELPDREAERLAARLALHQAAPPTLTGLKKRIDPLEMKARIAIGDFLVEVVHADGVVDPAEVRSLEKVFKILGLDPSTLYSKLHVVSAEPVRVRPATEDGPTYRIPAPPAPEKREPSLKLDMAKVAALKADSAKVSALLGSLFSDAPAAGSVALEVQEPEPNTPTTEDAGPLPGLDSEHQDLLLALLQRPQWARAELEEICSDRNLMVDGAIERINEASFDRYDQAMIEGEDPLDINGDLLLEETA